MALQRKDNETLNSGGVRICVGETQHPLFFSFESKKTIAIFKAFAQSFRNMF